MANYYTQWSEEVANLTQEEEDWLEQVLRNPYGLDKDDFNEWTHALQIDSVAARLNKGPFDLELWPAFGYSFCEEPGGTRSLWMYSSDGGADIENIVLLIQVFLAKFRPKDIWTLSWAYTCSEPRIGAYGGGGVAVTAFGERWVAVGNELAKHIKELESIIGK